MNSSTNGVRHGVSRLPAMGGKGSAKASTTPTGVSRRRNRSLGRQVISQALETLEHRQHLSAAPFTQTNYNPFPESAGAFDSNPAVAIDPTNLNRVVMVRAVKAGGAFAISGVASLDGGKTYPLSFSVPMQSDISTAGTPYARVGDLSIGYDRQNQFYVTSLQTNLDGSSGALVVSRFNGNYSGPADLLRQDLIPETMPINDRVLYQWANNTSDAINSATMTVSTNIGNYTDPAGGTVADSSINLSPGGQNPLYVAYSTNLLSAINPNQIFMVSSSDAAISFSAPNVVAGGGGRYTAPKILVSQGHTGNSGGEVVEGGTVAVIYTDTSGPVTDGILSTNLTTGPAVELKQTNAAPFQDVPAGSPAGTTRVTTVPIGTIAAPIPGAATIADISVDLHVRSTSALTNVRVDLVNTTTGVTAPLFLRNDVAGNTLGVFQRPGGAFVEVDSVFTTTAAVRAFGTPGLATPYNGFIQPSTDPLTLANLSDFIGGSYAGTWNLVVTDFNPDAATQSIRASLNITTSLVLGNETSVGGTAVRSHAPGTTTVIPQAPTNRASPALPTQGIGPGVSAAIDSTLGDNPRYFDPSTGKYASSQGRMYVAFVVQTPGVAADTNIALSFSDDGGASWTLVPRVNDDNTELDGYSGSISKDDGNVTAGRAQFMPQVAVDQITGNVVLSWYDARYDSLGARVATMVGISTTGGTSFLPQSFANTPNAVKDAVTNQVLTNRPIPDNFSAANAGNLDAFDNSKVGIGHQIGLAVAGGVINVGWIGNENGGLDPLAVQTQSLLSSRLTFSGGPTVLTVDEGAISQPTTLNGYFIEDVNNPGFLTRDPGTGNAFDAPVQTPGDTTDDGSTPIIYNSTTAVDGRTRLDAFLVKFDRLIDATSFTASDVVVRYRTATQSGNEPGEVLTILRVTALYADPTTFKDQNLRVLRATDTFVVYLAAPQDRTGTYSFIVNPGNIRDTVAHSFGVGATQFARGNKMDTDGDGIAGETGATNFTTGANGIETGDYFQSPRPVNRSTSYRRDANGVYFAPSYDSSSKPLSLSGLHVANVEVIPTGSTTALPTTTTIVNQSISTVRVTFDRSVDPNSFTSQQILRIVGPNGTITGPKRYFGTNLGAIADKASPAKPFVSDLLVNDDYIIGDVNVTVNLTHADLSQLLIELVSPSGDIVQLVQQNTLTGANLSDTTFDDTSTATLASGTAPYTNVTGYRPATGALSDLNGDSAKGVWKLRVTDKVTGVVGTLNSWSLQLTPDVSSFTVTPVAGSSNKSFDIKVPTLATSGGYSVTLSSQIRAIDGTLLDSNLDAGTASLFQDSNATVNRNFVSNQVPVTIPNNGSVTSTITVPTNQTYNVESIAVQLSITYANDPLLTATLTGPNGEVVTLFSGVGGNTTNRANFQNTTFRDSTPASPTTPIQNGSAPFFGTFSPQESLSADFVGSLAAGTWTLTITSSGTATGTRALTGWNLTLGAPVVSSGFGTPVADEAQLSFKVFTLGASLPASSSAWTAVGASAATNADGTQSRTGAVTSITLDPSDPTGNTAYAAGRSGGVWKTRNFLDASGQPLWVPITDFGPIGSLSIASIAVRARNNDSNQSIVIAATGDGDSSQAGVGFLISEDGGQSWRVMDSSSNFDTLGAYLPLDSGDRDHVFSLNGASVYRVVADPNPTTAGETIFYAAIDGPDFDVDGDGTLDMNPAAGIWRSLDSGRTWVRALAERATDVYLDPSSGYFNTLSNPTGNLQYVWAAVRGSGVLLSQNRGFTWQDKPGDGGNPLKVDVTLTNPPSGQIPTVASNVFGGTFNRITLTKPALTGDAVQDLLLQGWVYALVSKNVTAVNGNPQSSLDSGEADLYGLFVTKDFGLNWTKVFLPSTREPDTYDIGTYQPEHSSVPVNGIGTQGSYDPTRVNVSEQPPPAQRETANSTLTVAVDPNNANIVYVGGQSVIRVDTTYLYDPHALFIDQLSATDSLPNDATAGGPVDFQYTPGQVPNTFDPINTPYINLTQNPLAPYASNTTIPVRKTDQFRNNGLGSTWTYFGDNQAAGETALDGSLRAHDMVTIKDPVTGKTRLIIGNEMGVYTVLDDGTGRVYTDPTTYRSVNGSRNGNLQLGELISGAAAPSVAVAQALGTMFLGAGRNVGVVGSSADILSTGNTTYTGKTGDGFYVAIGQTGQNSNGGTNAVEFDSRAPSRVNPNGIGATDFFQVSNGFPGQAISRTSGLFTTSGAPQFQTGDASFPDQFGSLFAVNPINTDQLLLVSPNGRLAASNNEGRAWTPLADTATFGSIPSALAFGSPDPRGPGGPDATNFNFYVGTQAGKAFLTRTGGGTNNGTSYIDISAGLDGTPVRQIVTNPIRGSYEAYAVTAAGVYHIADASLPGATWENITGNIFSLQSFAFGDPNQPFQTMANNGLWTIAVDWRYQIPDAPGSANSHPVLFVGGAGGVLRSTTDGTGTDAWEVFPSIGSDGAATNGGNMPSVVVRDLDLSIGNIDPTNGQPNTFTGEAILLATTFGRGQFAIRVPALVIPDALTLNPADDTGPTDSFESGIVSTVATPRFTGTSQASAFGNTVKISIVDLSDLLNPRIIGGYNPADATTDIAANYTDFQGSFSVQVNVGALATDGTYKIGFQTYQSISGDADGSNTEQLVSAPYTITYTLDTTAPAAPVISGLEDDQSDTGTLDTDNVTNNTTPVIVGTAEGGRTVTLFVRLPGSATLTQVGSAVAADDGVWAIAPLTPLPEGVSLFSATQQDNAGNTSPVSNVLSLTIDTTAPTQPVAPTLAAASDTGVQGDNITSNTLPTINITVDPNSIVTIQVDALAPVAIPANLTGLYSYPFTTALTEGSHTITVTATDVAGNVSTPSTALNLTIDTTAPAAPSAPAIVAADDSGLSNTDGITNDSTPRVTGTITPNSSVLVFVDGNQAGTGTADASGVYVVQLSSALTDGLHALTIRETDVANNQSPLSAAGSVTIDTLAPSNLDTKTLTDIIKGQAVTRLVATFNDANPFGSSSINWGDGVTSTGLIEAGAAPTINVTGTHTFGRSGTFNYSVSVTDVAGNTSSDTDTATVTGLPVSPGGVTLPLTEAVDSGTVVVATFTDPTGAEPIESYNAAINWGDGTTSTGVITYNATANVFSVSSNHRYGEDGTYNISITVTTGGANAVNVISRADVTPQAVVLTGVNITPNEGVAFTGAVATFLDGGDAPAASDFVATIVWGDGSASETGTIVADANNPKLFSVVGTHTYATGSTTYPITITVVNKGTITSTASATATVGNTAPTPAFAGQTTVFAGAAATFRLTADDASSLDDLAGFTYTVNWKDGTPNSTVPATASNGSGVSVSHTFANVGTYAVEITATDQHGASSTLTQTLTVIATPVITGVTIDGTVTGTAGYVPDVNVINFTISAGSGITLPTLDLSAISIIRNAGENRPTTGATFTFDTATGNGSLNVDSLNLPDGDYEVRIAIPNGPTKTVQFSRLYGDLNRDGVVNKTDINLVKSTLGATAGSPAYIAAADFNGDGRIDANDVKTITARNKAKIASKSKVVKVNPIKTVKLPKQSYSAKLGQDTSAQDIILTNTDKTRALSLSSLSLTGDPQYSLAIIGQDLGTTSVTIPAGGVVVLRVYFRPQRLGTATGSVTFGIGLEGSAPQIVRATLTGKVK